FISSQVANAHLLGFLLGLVLKQSRGGDINSGAGVFHDINMENIFAQNSGGEEAADVRGQAANDHRGDSAGAQQSRQAGMVGSNRISVGVSLEAIAPNGVKAIRV